MSFLISNNSGNPVVLYDLGNISIPDSTTDRDLELEFSEEQIKKSESLYDAILAGTITAKNQDDIAIGATGITLYETLNFVQQSSLYNYVEDIYSSKTIRVKKDNLQQGEFSSIKSAVDSITTASTSNPFIVKIEPGLYIEDTITMKTGIFLVADTLASVIIVPGTSSNTIIHGVDSSGIQNLILTSANGTGGIGIYYEGINGAGFLVKDCNFNNNETNIHCYGSTGSALLYVDRCSITGNSTNGILVDNINNISTSAILTNCTYKDITIPSITTFGKVKGPNTSLAVTNTTLRGASDTNNTAFHIEDGALFRINASSIIGFNTGVYVPNIGSSSSLTINSVELKSNTYDVNNLHPSTTLNLTGNADKDKIFSASTDFGWNFLDLNNEVQISNKLSVTFPQGTHTEVIELLKNQDIGLISGGIISGGTGKAVNITAAVGYLINSNSELAKIEIGATSGLSCPTSNTQYYIYINQSGVFTASTTEPASTTTILLGRIVTTSTGILFIDQVSKLATNRSASYDDIASEIFGALYVSGSLCSEGSTGKLDVSSGKYYVGSNDFMPSGGSDITFNTLFESAAGVWTYGSTSVVSNTQYNNLSGYTLDSIPAGKFVKHLLSVVGDGTNEQYFLVYSQDTYDTLGDAETASIPQVPSHFTNGVVKIASIIMQEGVTGIASIISERPRPTTQASSSAGVSSHLGLTDLTSGDAGHTQFYMLNGTTPLAATLDVNFNNITNVGTINGVTAQTHASRHLPNGADPLSTGLVSDIGYTGTTGTANAFARQDHIHAHGNLNDPNHHDAVTITGNGFMTSSDKIKLNNISTPTYTTGYLLIADGASYNGTAMTGDATITSDGVLTIGPSAITDSKINSISWNKITSTPTTLAGYGITDAGNVFGATGSTSNGIVRFDSTTGKYLKNTNITIDDSNNIAGPNSIVIGSTTIDTSAILDIISTSKGFGLPSMTTAQRDAITSPRDGLYVHTTDGTNGLSARVNGAWLGIPALPLRITIPSPSSAENLELMYTTTQVRVSRILSVIVGTGGPSVTFSIRYGSDRSSAGTEVVTSGITVTNTTTGLSTTTFDNATIPANNFIWITTSAKSGAVTSLHASINFN